MHYKVQLACFLRASIGSVDVLKGNLFFMYFELHQPPKGSFNYHDFQWVNKEISGHGFRKVCAFEVIPWSKIPYF